MNVIQQKITDSLQSKYMPYSAYVILHRAIPEIDGMKPVQRRILYTMYKMGLLKGNRKKSQSVVGQTMFLSPHGDTSIYEAIVRMSKDNETLLVPYIDSKGNFGKRYSKDMQYASARYTEVRLENIASELFDDIEKNTVDMIDNYDNTTKEPRLIPVSFPTILTNPTQGTAVGMASNICSFNLSEVNDFIIHYIDNQQVKVSEYIKAPDFSTGASVIYDEKIFDNIYETGKGTFKIRAKYEFIDKNKILISEIPYTTTIEAIMDKITELIKVNKIKDIVDMNDVYGVSSQGIEVTVKNSTDKELLMQRLFKATSLEDSFSCNFNVIVNGSPKLMGIKQMVNEWLKFRIKCIRRGMEYDINKKSDKLHLLNGLKKALLDIDNVVNIVRNTKKNSEIIENLKTSLNVDDIQAEFIADIKLRYLNEEYILNRIGEIKSLTEEINELKDTIDNKRKILSIIQSQLKNISEKYGQPRKTEIIYQDELASIDEKEIEVENYNTRIFVTKDGYLKKIPLVSMRGNMKLKDGDSILHEFNSSNASDILIFTDQYNCYKVKAHEIDDHKPSVLGEYIPSLLSLKDEKVLYVTSTEDYKGSILLGFSDGKIAKINLSSYETKTNRTMLKNAYTSEGEIIYWNTIAKDIDLVAVSSIDKVLVFNTSIFKPKGKSVTGNMLMKSKNDSKMVNVLSLDDVEFEDVEYYRTVRAGVGKFLKKEDSLSKSE